MKPCVLLFAFLTFVLDTFAQPQTTQDENIVSKRGSVQVLPRYQRWSMNNSFFAQASSVLSLYEPLGSNASLSLSGSYGSSSGDIATLRGPADIQFSCNYHVESANMMIGLGVGVPSGKKKLTPEEFITSILISNNVFRLQVPSLGSGLNLSPSVVWALPLNDDFVLGLGASFQYRGSFSPLQGYGKYDPGEEISGTFGLNVRIDETSTISADVVYTRYGKDKVDGANVYAAGGKILGAMQFKKYFSRNELLLLATFRTKAKPEIAVGSVLVPVNNRIDPNQAEILAAYTAQFNERISTQFTLEGRFFQQTTAPLSGFNLVGVGVMPAFRLSENITLPLFIKYSYGKAANSKLSGIEAGLGITITY